jgi:hypothetical protein
LPPHTVTTISFGIAGTVEFVGCGDIPSQVPGMFSGWIVQPIQQAPDKLSARIEQQQSSWTWKSFGTYVPRDWVSVPPKDPIRVITDVQEAVLHWYLAANPHLLCLHAAAVEVGDGLVLLPARGRTGKSILMAHLAFLGARVFGDDVIAYRDSNGIALGFHTRLRLPLPTSLTPPVRTFIVKNAGPAGFGWHYLRAPKGLTAQLGESRPIKAIVLPRRTESTDSGLSTASTADVLKALISENIIRTRPMLELFEAMHDLAQSRPKYWLNSSDPLRAGQQLIEAFR